MAVTLFAGCGEEPENASQSDNVTASQAELARESKKAETEQTIKTLRASLERFNQHWNFYPPSNIYRLSSSISGTSAMDPNATNTGIEAMVVALRTRLEGGPFVTSEFLQTYQCNADNDEIAENFANVEGALKLFEIRDGWGNPLVYVNLLELQSADFASFVSVTNADGAVQKIDLGKLKESLIDPATNVPAAKSWCIWSVGEDGINQYGRGDDVTSWNKIEE